MSWECVICLRAVSGNGQSDPIAGQLIDTSSGTHLWADRFEGALENVFELQDKVTASVVGAIAPRLQQAEIGRARRKPTESLDAYDFFLRGRANYFKWTREANKEALRLYYKAIELDPDSLRRMPQPRWFLRAEGVWPGHEKSKRLPKLEGWPMRCAIG